MRQGVPLDGAVDELLAAASAGTVQALVLCRTDLTAWRDAGAVRAALERVPYVVVLDTEQRETAEYANVVLPDRHARRERRHVHESRRSCPALPARRRAAR